jgi:hypothetical protein
MLTLGYDYSGLVEYDDDIIQIDWDTAVSKADLALFGQIAREDMTTVLVAPCLVYEDAPHGKYIRTEWNATVFVGPDARQVCEDDDRCDLFGFGMIYLPRDVIRAFSATGYPFDDTHFANWHSGQYGSARLTWKVRPVHLNYRISEVIK